MSAIKLDKNYNFVEEQKSPFEDAFLDAAAEIIQAHAEKVLTGSEASFLLDILFRKEFHTMIESSFELPKMSELHSIYQHMQMKKKKYAR